MKFDLLNISKCLTSPATLPCKPVPQGAPNPPTPCCDQPEFSSSNPTICSADDDRCGDPDFAAQNPALCPNSPRIIVKPSVLLKEAFQQVTYQAFLLVGGQEQYLSSGVVWSCNDASVAQIGGGSGKCSTIAPGICAISATWQGNSGYGQLEVVADCAAQETDFLILIDDSASMSAAFSNQYPTKLSFAKTQAQAWVETVNLTKDKVGVLRFAEATIGQIDFSQNVALIKNAIGLIKPTTATTNLKDALEAASTFFDDAGVTGRRVVVLFTDGENKAGGNPLPVAADFEAGGNIILVVGVRAYNGGFTLLEAIASGGFFINAYQNDQASIADWLSGLKGYICSGNCATPGGVSVPYAALDYDGFINWDVTGKVDLIGDGGKPLYDLLPGNGLYVDMCGSSPTWLGTLTLKPSKRPTLVHDVNYALSLYVAGNQREARAGDLLSVSLVTGTAPQVSDVIQVDNYLQDFTKYTWAFTPLATDIATIVLATAANTGTQFFGLLIDRVEIRNTDTDTVVFLDNFDGENLTYFPPNCTNNPPITPGKPPVFNYPTCYAQGCLDQPIPAQVPDPFPTTDVELCSLTGIVARARGGATQVLGDSVGLEGGGGDTVMGA